MKRLFLAVRFLTVIPLGKEDNRTTEDDLAASVYYYPLVGVLLGILLYLSFKGGLSLWPPPLAAALTVTVWAVLTGGLHLDGLMDTFDGLGIRGDMEKRLAVMRDSRVGAFGVQAAVLFLLLKVAATASLAGSFALQPFLIVAPVAGRTAMVALMATGTYARKEGGLGRLFIEKAGAPQLVVCLLSFFVVTGLLAGKSAPAAAASQVVVFLIVRFWFCRSFGGVTGDLLGAACEIQELSVLILAILFS